MTSEPDSPKVLGVIRPSPRGVLAQTLIPLFLAVGVYGSALLEGFRGGVREVVWLIATTVVLVFAVVRASGTKCVLDDERQVVIRNFWKTHQIPWASVKRVRPAVYILARGWVPCVAFDVRRDNNQVETIKVKCTVYWWKYNRDLLIESLRAAGFTHGVPVEVDLEDLQTSLLWRKTAPKA